MLHMQAIKLTVQPRAADGGAMSAPWQDCSRREVVIGGMSTIAASQVLSSNAASASTQSAVTPVNITAKETMELGQSGGWDYSQACGCDSSCYMHAMHLLIYLKVFHAWCMLLLQGSASLRWG